MSNDILIADPIFDIKLIQNSIKLSELFDLEHVRPDFVLCAARYGKTFESDDTAVQFNQNGLVRLHNLWIRRKVYTQAHFNPIFVEELEDEIIFEGRLYTSCSGS